MLIDISSVPVDEIAELAIQLSFREIQLMKPISNDEIANLKWRLLSATNTHMEYFYDNFQLENNASTEKNEILTKLLKLKPHHALIFLYLKHNKFVSYDKSADDLSMAKSSVFRACNKLRSLGILDKENGTVFVKIQKPWDKVNDNTLSNNN